MKTIVTHVSVDLDAITSCWLVRRFLPGWSKAEIVFVHAGKTLKDRPPDENKEIIHVDTGCGCLDHHQTNEYTCAAKKVYQYLLQNKSLDGKLVKPLERLVEYANCVDHFAEAFYPDATDDKYEFSLSQIVEGLKATVKEDIKITDIVFSLLDAVLQLFKRKIKAEYDIKRGFVFLSNWGKSIAIESCNEESLKLALKTGFKLAIRKDPEKKSIRIKTLPNKSLDLTPIYKKIKENDLIGDWYLHISKNMLLNGSSKNPGLKPSSLSLQRLIEIIKEI